jgi:hypothetical protein
MHALTSLTTRAAFDAAGERRNAPSPSPDATEFIVRSHDPARGRCPAPRIGRVLDDRVCAALTWNVFQTLAMVAPSFWLRRLRARLFGIDAIDPVPLDASIDFWMPVGARAAAAGAGTPRADVLIDTQHAVFGLMTLFEDDVPLPAAEAHGDRLLQLIDALSAHAGVRDAYVGLVTTAADDSPVAASLVDRYAQSHEMIVRRLPARRDGLVNLCGVGRATWGDLHAILRDCAGAPVLDDLERYAAARTGRWLTAAGVSPAG